jgi:transposase InsO family protein
MTDNGPAYVSTIFAELCRNRSLRHIRTRPYTPRTNGKAERLIQTLLREWAYIRPYNSSALRTQRLASWLRHYNHRRPHGSLNGKPPISRVWHRAE